MAGEKLDRRGSDCVERNIHLSADCWCFRDAQSFPLACTAQTANGHRANISTEKKAICVPCFKSQTLNRNISFQSSGVKHLSPTCPTLLFPSLQLPVWCRPVFSFSAQLTGFVMLPSTLCDETRPTTRRDLNHVSSDQSAEMGEKKKEDSKHPKLSDTAAPQDVTSTEHKRHFNEVVAVLDRLSETLNDGLIKLLSGTRAQSSGLPCEAHFLLQGENKMLQFCHHVVITCGHY